MGTIARELSNKSDEELKEWVEGGYICCVYLISFNNLVGMCLTTHPPQYYWGGGAEVKLTTSHTQRRNILLPRSKESGSKSDNALLCVQRQEIEEGAVWSARK